MTTKNLHHPTENNRSTVREGNTKGNINHAPTSPRPSTPPPSQRRPPSEDRQTTQSENTSQNNCS